VGFQILADRSIDPEQAQAVRVKRHDSEGFLTGFVAQQTEGKKATDQGPGRVNPAAFRPEKNTIAVPRRPQFPRIRFEISFGETLVRDTEKHGQPRPLGGGGDDALIVAADAAALALE